MAKKEDLKAGDLEMRAKLEQLRDVLRVQGILVSSVNDAQSLSLKKPEDRPAAIETAKSMGLTMKLSKKLSIKLDDNANTLTDANEQTKSELKPNQQAVVKVVPVQKVEKGKRVASARTTKKNAAGAVTEANTGGADTETGTNKKVTQFSKESKGGLSSHVTVTGEAFMGLIKGIASNRFTEVVLVYMDTMGARAQKQLAKSVAEKANYSVGEGLTKAEIEIFQKVSERLKKK